MTDSRASVALPVHRFDLGGARWRQVRVLWVGIALCALAWGTARIARPPSGSDAEAPPAPANERTCEDPAVASLPEGFRTTRRHLIPIDSETLGVKIVYEDGARSVIAQSGASIEDMFESFDDIQLVEPLPGAPTAERYEGSYLDREVHIANWEVEEARPPCELRSIVAIGVDAATFERIVGPMGS